ncbi:50S ribosomal protein L9 [Spirochaetia bacterium]|nr:50S ribosomal protein L9 [Spirochaetia bacterium]
MKVILNKDLSTLGEEGDIKDVAKGYARNFLFPRKIALPYTEGTIHLFEARKSEIEARKAQKRKEASSLKERLETLELSITMPAGPNGKLYGAVTSQTLADELLKQGFEIERKRIEIPGNTIKNVGRYKIVIKLYGNEQAETSLAVLAQEVKTEEKPAEHKTRRHHRDEVKAEAAADTGAVTAPEDTVDTSVVDTSAATAQDETPAVSASAETPAAPEETQA